MSIKLPVINTDNCELAYVVYIDLHSPFIHRHEYQPRKHEINFFLSSSWDEDKFLRKD